MDALLPENLSTLNHLRLRWAIYALCCTAVLVAAAIWLEAAWQPGYAFRWLGQSTVVAVYLLWVLWRALPENHRPGEARLLPTFGAGNSMTLLRGMLIACLAGFLFSPRPAIWHAWLPGLVYTLAALMDYGDGYLARVTNHATRMGEILDMSLDGIAVLTASVLAVQYGQVPVWYLAVAMARYVYVAGLWLWDRLGKPTYPLSPSIRRRAFAGLQMGFLIFILWPVFSPPGTYLAAALFSVPFLAGFLLDGLMATGILHKPEQTAGLWHAAARWLPLPLRLASALLLLGLLSHRFSGSGEGLVFFGARSLQDPGWWLLGLGLLEGIAAAFLLLGAAARFTSILGLFLLGVSQILVPLNPAQISLAVIYTAILYLGSGALSLWTPEDRMIYRKAGERLNPVPADSLLQGES